MAQSCKIDSDVQKQKQRFRYKRSRLGSIWLLGVSLGLVAISALGAYDVHFQFISTLVSDGLVPKPSIFTLPFTAHESGADTTGIDSAAPLPVHDYSLPAVQNGMVPVLSSIPTKQRVVFLTIDDGIVTNSNDAAVMQRNQVRATFFLVYRFINGNPSFFANLAHVTGSDVENHSYDHYMLTNLTYEQQRIDICRNADVFKGWFGRRPDLFRPSGGAYNDDTRRASAACGMKALIMWDASINNGVLRLQNGSKLQPGDIVLMHFRATFDEDLTAFARGAKAANLQPDLLVNWLY